MRDEGRIGRVMARLAELPSRSIAWRAGICAAIFAAAFLVGRLLLPASTSQPPQHISSVALSASPLSVAESDEGVTPWTELAAPAPSAIAVSAAAQSPVRRTAVEKPAPTITLAASRAPESGEPAPPSPSVSTPSPSFASPPSPSPAVDSPNGGSHPRAGASGGQIANFDVSE